MDGGEVIPGLNEDWTFANCKVFEWISGFMVSFLVATVVEKPGTAIPFLLLIWVGSTLTLSYLRRQFPDETRGVANLFILTCGVCPPGIPRPARIQPRWSGGRISSVREGCMYTELGLDDLRHMSNGDARRPGR